MSLSLSNQGHRGNGVAAVGPAPAQATVEEWQTYYDAFLGSHTDVRMVHTWTCACGAPMNLDHIHKYPSPAAAAGGLRSLIKNHCNSGGHRDSMRILQRRGASRRANIRDFFGAGRRRWCSFVSCGGFEFRPAGGPGLSGCCDAGRSTYSGTTGTSTGRTERSSVCSRYRCSG